MRVIAAGRTDVGLQREHNEDSFVLLDQHNLFVVADGMGGHRSGDVASKLATDTITEFFNTTAREDATWPFHYDPTLSAEENRLVTGIKIANKSIYEHGVRSRNHQGMGTTVVGMLFSNSARKIYVGHVGDSRCYRLRDSALSPLTQDHSLLNDWLRAVPELPQEQRNEVPRNVITRALGMGDNVQVDVSNDETTVGDRYVLCSDGLSTMVSDDEILSIVSTATTPDDAVQQLVDLANKHGGEDNVTVIVAFVLDDE
ncbi:MAG: Stp1/IreP family PP2C-type Ser/Thr phosphatase [Deltaproteobacteria bacterium]|nr:Stp1/IreP family PP2C-type Ser/Thr phosphatase [Deltaproteobacteria bacterium]